MFIRLKDYWLSRKPAVTICLHQRAIKKFFSLAGPLRCKVGETRGFGGNLFLIKTFVFQMSASAAGIIKTYQTACQTDTAINHRTKREREKNLCLKLVSLTWQWRHEYICHGRHFLLNDFWKLVLTLQQRLLVIAVT